MACGELVVTCVAGLRWIIGAVLITIGSMEQVLSGICVVVTRDERGNADFAGKIGEQGGSVLEFATIKIEPLTQGRRFWGVSGKINGYNWVVFTSPNGVVVFYDYLQSVGKDWAVLGSAKVAAVGSMTAARLERFGAAVDFVPSVFTTGRLAGQLIGHENLQGRGVLLLRSQLASNQLAEDLALAGAVVEEVPLYTVVPVKGECERLVEAIKAGRIDWTTFASPSSVRSFFSQIAPEIVNAGSVAVASIGPVTSGQLRDIGVKVNIEAAEHTIDGLLRAICAEQQV